jgi:CheY-like chemotaxis protein
MKNILMADNEAADRELMSRHLKRAGFNVLLAADGERAVAVAREKKPDLILMDIDFKVPNFDGIRALDELRAAEETRGIPIIALTGFTMADNFERVQTAGFDGYEKKPIDYPGLIEKVRSLLDRV